MKLRLLPLGALVLLSLPSALHAQSRSAQVYIGATDGVRNLPSIVYDNSDGAAVSVSNTSAFTGLDRGGNERTMTYSGSSWASAEYGRLRARVSGSLQNAYYNAENAPYYDPETGDVDPSGSPDQFGVLAFSGFEDGLQFGGQLASGYKARYVFFVHGVRSGPNVIASLYCTIGDNPTEYFSGSDAQGENAEYFTTKSYTIDGSFRQSVKVQFTTQFNPNTIGLADGADVYGSGDYSSTATLSQILLFDANDRPVGSYTVTGGSGTTYPTSPVPEPASLAALATGGIALLARRRRNRAGA